MGLEANKDSYVNTALVGAKSGAEDGAAFVTPTGLRVAGNPVDRDLGYFNVTAAPHAIPALDPADANENIRKENIAASADFFQSLEEAARDAIVNGGLQGSITAKDELGVLATDSLAGAYGILAGESDFTQRPNEPVKTGHLKIKIPNAAGTPEEKEFKLPFELYVPQSEDIIGQDKEFVHRLCVEGTSVRSAAGS